MLKDRSAAELADALDGMVNYPHNTGGLSMIDEATYAFGRRSQELAEAQRKFSDARHAHMRSYTTASGNYTDASWQAAMDAAHQLATLLRPLGDTRIVRCGRPDSMGTCSLPLNDDGTCNSSFHL
jgi:hypothetical protein